MNGGGLMIAFGSFNNDAASKTAIGRTVQAVLEEAGIAVQWNGNPEHRLSIPEIDWKRRFGP